MKYLIYICLIIAIVGGGLGFIADEALGADVPHPNKGTLANPDTIDGEVFQACIPQARSMVRLYWDAFEPSQEELNLFSAYMLEACLYMAQGFGDYSVYVQFVLERDNVQLPYKGDLEDALKRRMYRDEEYRL